MKKIFILFIASFFSYHLIAQKNTVKNIPDFGSVDKNELEMKDCEFDAKAEAIMLLDDGLITYYSGNGMELKRRIRIKILNTKGLDWANVHLRYKSEQRDQDIKDLEAQTYNLDANGNISVTKIDKKLIYEKALNKKFSEKVFTFPNVRVGSVIEYRFTHAGIGLIDWYFQHSIPVTYSHFTMDFPGELEVTTYAYCNRSYETKDASTSTRSIKSYSMSQVPSLKDEPYIINEDFYRERLETKVIAFNDMGRRINRVTNWVNVVKNLMDDQDFGLQLNVNIPRTKDLDEKLQNITSPYQRMKTVFTYVQTNMVWNEYTGIWALNGVKSAWKNKKGTAGEINLILVNLLKDADLNAFPILVSTHDNGIVNTIDAGTFDNPGYHQFNKVMAYVIIDKQYYILDASDKMTPADLIPPEVLMTEGLVIGKVQNADWGWKQLWKDNLVAKNVFMINAEIDETGKMSGKSLITSYDYAKLSRLGVVKKGKDKFIEKYVTDLNPGLNVEEVKFENIEVDSLPLIQSIKFNQPLNSAGEYKYFSINLLTGLEKNPFISDNRSADVFFGYKQSYYISGLFHLPEDFEFNELPKNLKMRLPDTSIVISRLSKVTNNTLEIRVQLDFKKPYYPVAQYAEVQEFYQRLFEILNEQFVIRKKKKV